MRVILLQNVKNIGQANKVVEVADGFARNFLLRRNLAKIADSAGISALERERQEREIRARVALERSRALVGKIESLNLQVSLPGSSAGGLYAALKESEILARVRKSVPGLPPDAGLVDYAPIKSAGAHELELQMAEKVRASLKLTVSTDAKK